MQREPHDQIVKMMLIGDSNVGKTSLMKCFCHQSRNPREPTTLGLEYAERIVNISGSRVLVQLWDTAGQERFRTVTPSYYRSAMGILLVFSLKEKESFNSVEMWMRQIHTFAEDEVPVVILANKLDEKYKEVTEKQSQALSERHRTDLLMTSAKDNINVDDSIIRLYHKISKDKRALHRPNLPTGRTSCFC